MPIVPFPPTAKGRAKSPRPAPAEPFALMAAAVMHAEGRLIPDEPSPKGLLNE